ncbi:MAG: glycoside hydrolase family 3 C-terminal domain-containing protein [Spirochaetaceae bacterium]|jgi:beta-glucosidase|nr:glycoside hydrolase family 3 C-terminal domain-containing protein [Spirochaetaceae bacterium]
MNFKQKRLANTPKAIELLNRLSTEEKVRLMSGSTKLEDLLGPLIAKGSHYNESPYPAGGSEKTGLPPLMFCDGPRGVVCGIGKSTCFPVPLCRGAGFDPALERSIGKAIGREVKAWGGNLFAGVCVNLPWHPGWGRSQETYGEDSVALGTMGAALVEGVQSEQVMACVKHYAFNSMEISRFKVSIDCDPRTEREVFLPHFKDCVDAGAASIMSAYNRFRGICCGQNDYLLRRVLKEEWDFDGFVLSDFISGMSDTVQAANAGQDLEMCCTIHFGDKLIQAVRDGRVAEERIDDSALRIIRTVITFEEGRKKDESPQKVLGCKKHRALALQSAREGITLLQNRHHALPLDPRKLKRLALIGRLGNRENLGDNGSSKVFPAHTVTILEGLEKAAPDTEIVFYMGSNSAHGKKLARESDAVIFVAGYDHLDEGEYAYPQTTCIGDRTRGLSLHEDEIEMIRGAGPENKRSAVILIGGGTILITGWKDAVSSILMAYYPGQEGGTAIAEILLGKLSPGGKLPFVLPVREADLPRINWDTETQWYDYYHGYRKLEKEGVAPLLPYGFGLSYTSFKISSPCFETDGKTITASCTVHNSGGMDGDEVVQMYAGFKHSKIDRPVKTLCGFSRVHLKAREEKRVFIACPVERLRYYNTAKGTFELEHMKYEVYIGTSSADKDLFLGSIKL